MPHIPSYSSIFALGHRALGTDFLSGPVVVEEKLDGSQLSAMVDADGELVMRSKGADIIIDNPPAMFKAGVDAFLELATEMVPGWVYRGEYLQKPKHNTLAYARVPAKHVIIFDIDRGGQDYLDPDEKRTEAGRLGLEVVPTFFEGRVESLDALKALLERESCLGGAKPEGFVLKRYDAFGEDKKTLMAKYVTEAFKEVHGGEWRKANPKSGDIIQSIIESFKTEARWQKAVQHLRERGVLTDSPKDIGALMREVAEDVSKEAQTDIRDTLFKYAWPHIHRGITAGVPQWYKDQLARRAFAPESADAA